MPNYSDEEVLITGDYDGVKLNEYNDTFSLNAVHKGSNDVWYLVYIYNSRFKDGESIPDPNQAKPWPMKVRLGDKETTIKTLKALLAQLDGPF